MYRGILFLILSIFSISFTQAVEKNNGVIDYKIRSDNYNKYSYDNGVGKLSLDIEVNLVNGRLPNKAELKAVSNEVLKNKPNAYMKWISFYLPKMKSGSGSYASDHRTPKPEGVKIQDYMLFGTSYESLLK